MSVHRPVTPEDWARRKQLDALAYRRRRARFYAAHRRGATCQVKHGGQPCGTVLRDVVDRFGRVHAVCERCERQRQGICGRCPRPVAGTKGKAMYCQPCKRIVQLERDKRWAQRNPERKAATVRAWREKHRRAHDAVA